MYEAGATIVLAVISSLIAWFVADVRSKSRLTYMSEQLNEMETKMKEGGRDYQLRLSALERSGVLSDQDRSDLHRWVDRLDATKASKEVVDGIRSDISGLKADIDKRFDKLERLLENRRE